MGVRLSVLYHQSYHDAVILQGGVRDPAILRALVFNRESRFQSQSRDRGSRLQLESFVGREWLTKETFPPTGCWAIRGMAGGHRASAIPALQLGKNP